MDLDESADDEDEERTGAIHLRHQYLQRVHPLLQALQVKRDGPETLNRPL